MHRSLFAILIGLFVLAGLSFWSLQNKPLGNVPANAPNEAIDPSWKTFENGSVTYRYPETFSTTYVTANDWPPQVQVLPGPYSCTEAGEINARSGKTEERTVGGRTYCVTRVVGAAAGSTYTQYAYVAGIDGRVAILTFSVREPNCGNYADGSTTSACEGEQSSFDIDALMDRIMRTLQVGGDA